MHGLIFVTWEKYLTKRFGSELLNKYRLAIGETVATSPLADRVYKDEVLLAGVGAAAKLTGLAADTLLREYGRYYLLNELTGHRCAYLLNSVHSGRELLLTMRQAHAQMRMVPDGLIPPVFSFEVAPSNPQALRLIYDSSRQLCPVLWGAIEGAAQRYGDQVQIVELQCMRKGAAACLFDITFSPSSKQAERRQESPEAIARQQEQRRLDEAVLSVLPTSDGFTLIEIQQILRQVYKDNLPSQARLSILLEALRHLQHAGLAASTANQAGGDTLTSRRYWSIPQMRA